MEDAVVEQLSPLTGNGLSKLPVTGSAIEELSHRIIDRRLDSEKLPPEKHAVYRRIIHSTADFSFIDSLRIHDNAIEAGIKALRQGAPIICDVYMVAAGITRTAKEKICCINDPQVINRAKEEGCTRAAAAVIHLADRIAGSIFVVGNAPTALWKLMEIIQNGCRAPALIVGLPVGFVGAHESKTALWKSGLCCITNESPRGGSPAAAAAVNALALLAKQNIQDVKNPVPGA
ncbi:MAG TPA: precorrin-8X methylmutase [Spirochaetia bacterium]|nr:precorrin-8X methylmutase [Spirochaetia bacterium]